VSTSVPPATTHSEATRLGLESSTIMVVDDDRVTRTVVSTILGMEEQYHVLEAENGREALEVARAARPRLMILDVAMPELDGFAVCKAIREDPALAAMQVLILSGRGDKQDRELAREMGADAYLTKPFTSVGLVEVVRQMAGE
jgi:CheY-like chemotaxis protein